MAVVNLRQAGAAAGTDASALVAVGQGLVAVRDVTFLVGPGVMPGLNALLLGYVLYRSRLVPRAIPAMGLIGAVLFLVLAAASILGLNEQASLRVRHRGHPDLLLGAVARPLAHLQRFPTRGRCRPCF